MSVPVNAQTHIVSRTFHVQSGLNLYGKVHFDIWYKCDNITLKSQYNIRGKMKEKISIIPLMMIIFF